MDDIILLDKKSEKLIHEIIDLKREGLEFLQKSDETDYEEKIKKSGIHFVSAKEICFIHRNLGFPEDALVRPQLLESAVQRPINVFLYNDEISIASLASELCFGLVQNHAFIDGNKRSAVIYANHYLIAHGQGFLVIPEEHVPEFKRLLIRYYEGEDIGVISAFLKDNCWKRF